MRDLSVRMNAVPLSENRPIQSLGRVLDVLGLFDGERSALSLSEIALLLAWPIPTAHRAVGTLAERGFLARDPETKRFHLGAEIVRLAASLIAGFRLPELARSHLEALTEETGETASLAIIDGAEVLFLASSAGTFRLRVEVRPGLRTPAHCSAIGRCLLAQLEAVDARRRLGREPYEQGTEASAHTWAELSPRLDATRTHGYALSVGEFEVGLLACAVPVAARDGLVAAINVASTTARISPASLVDVAVPRLKAAAAAIGRAQGMP
jgi:DNA-binding IclR family transcriptional regulator